MIQGQVRARTQSDAAVELGDVCVSNGREVGDQARFIVATGDLTNRGGGIRPGASACCGVAGEHGGRAALRISGSGGGAGGDWDAT